MDIITIVFSFLGCYVLFMFLTIKLAKLIFSSGKATDENGTVTAKRNGSE